MAGIKSLAKDTAIYGMSSIVGRFLNWCLVPLYTFTFPEAEYGVVTYVYSIVALALIILTYGMETGFFRFANHDEYDDPMEVYSTTLISLALSSTLFLALLFCFLTPISKALECGDHPEYIAMMGVAVAIDAFSAIPFSYLRYRHRAMRFAVIKIINIAITIGLNIFWILICPILWENHADLISWCYIPGFGIGYIFLANVISSVIMMFLLLPELRGFKWKFNAYLWRRMLRYSWPLLVLGIAGIMNQTIDKILFPLLYPDQATAMSELGIYGANYKIAIVMVMFIQAYRFAYEPFIFARSKERGEDKLQAYRDAMLWFVFFSMIIFLSVMYYLDILRYFISPDYFSGLKVVPIIMVAEFFFGIFFNLSLWYKLTDHTIWGMWFSLLGLVIVIILNVVLVPVMGYMGCAWASVACYGVMMLASYFVGRIKYPIGYPVARIILIFAAGMAFYGLSQWLTFDSEALKYIVRSVLLIAFSLIFLPVKLRRLF